jgi:hypothetical protein
VVSMHEIYGDVHSPRDNGHSQKPEIGFYAFSKTVDKGPNFKYKLFP